jgi:hypothetical protein
MFALCIVVEGKGTTLRTTFRSIRIDIMITGQELTESACRLSRRHQEHQSQTFWY